MKEEVQTKNAPQAIGPYSHAIAVGDLVFVSGQLPSNPMTGRMPDGITAQTTQTIENIKSILADAGCTLNDVVKTTVYLAEMSLFGEMNDVYAKEFTAPFPARSAVAVKELPKQALVEIDVTAVRNR
ncbi:MAG: Rid family detoxifying hydrolase [Muribaculaceae bacterium]|jgi:2-iminobutanoate/2-iminopropanoate deaminase|nr:Rid family detoxifying hydrolase [Muribaculaceae bacterium]